jgi:L-lactate dehydrogenase complex protein LldG
MDILKSIRDNLAVSTVHDNLRSMHHHQPPVPEHDQLGLPPVAPDGLSGLFAENISAVGGRVRVVGDLSGAMEAVQAVIDDLGPKRIAVSDSPLLDRVLDGLQTDAEILRKASAGELFTCDVGITGAQFAIAETGTLVLESEEEFARLTSLVPDVHVCVVDGHRLRETMAEILDEMSQKLSPAVTFITGPSRTSDIELTVAIGVHGPRELYVIIVDPAAGSEGNEELVDSNL